MVRVPYARLAEASARREVRAVLGALLASRGDGDRAAALLLAVPLSLEAFAAASRWVAIRRAVKEQIWAEKHHTPKSEALRLASYPPPYPNGWYALATSAELVRGAPPIAVEALGREFVLWRGADTGVAGCLDASFSPRG